MKFNNYNKLLETSDNDNFNKSLKYQYGTTFNSLINIFEENQIKYKVKKGFDYKSDNKNISEFKEITFNINETKKKIKELIKNYELDEVFNIEEIGTKNFTFIIKEE